MSQYHMFIFLISLLKTNNIYLQPKMLNIRNDFFFYLRPVNITLFFILNKKNINYLDVTVNLMA